MTKKHPSNHRASDTDKYLTTDNEQLIELDTPAFLQWLEANDSFRFEAGFGGEDSYRARKEVLSGGEYWYAVKKVNGKLHKRFIGKSEDVTHVKLIEVAQTIRQPSARQKATEDNPTPATRQLQATSLTVDALQQQQSQIDELRQLIVNLQGQFDKLHKTSVDADSEKLTIDNQQLIEENQKLRDENQRLTNEIGNLVCNPDMRLLEDQMNSWRNNAKNLERQCAELVTERDELRRQLQELTKQVDNSVDNRDSKPDYEAIRDHILSGWRTQRRPENKERIKEALDRFISQL